jgi:hypothetical protein
VAKDKKKKKAKKANTTSSATGRAGKAAKRIKSLTENPLVADVVAAALVATAAALKDSNKARRLAAQASDQLTELAKEGADKGNAMWQLALEVGRRALEEYSSVPKPKARSAAKPKASPTRSRKRKPAAGPKK